MKTITTSLRIKVLESEILFPCQEYGCKLTIEMRNMEQHLIQAHHETPEEAKANVMNAIDTLETDEDLNPVEECRIHGGKHRMDLGCPKCETEYNLGERYEH